MGLLNDIKETVTPGSDGSDIDIDEDLMRGEGMGESLEVEEPEQEAEFDEDIEEEDGEDEWDSAYDFAEWWLEDEGFANMRDFGEKAMMWRLKNSEKYRDRVDSGLRVLSRVREAKEDLRTIQGEDGSSDYSEMAEKLEDGNTVIENLRKLSGEDEMLVQQGMGLASEAVKAIGNRASSSSGDVDASKEISEEERI